MLTQQIIDLIDRKKNSLLSFNYKENTEPFFNDDSINFLYKNENSPFDSFSIWIPNENSPLKNISFALMHIEDTSIFSKTLFSSTNPIDVVDFVDHYFSSFPTLKNNSLQK